MSSTNTAIEIKPGQTPAELIIKTFEKINADHLLIMSLYKESIKQYDNSIEIEMTLYDWPPKPKQ